MTAEDFSRTLKELMHRDPFQSFVVELFDGRQIEIDRPKSLAFRGGLAAGFARGRRPVRIDSDDVKQIVHAPTTALKEG